MIGVMSAFTEKELAFMRSSIGLELSDTKEYTDDELLDIFDMVTDELPFSLDADDNPTETGWLFEHIVDKFLELLNK